MSPLTEFDQRMEQMIREFALRIVVPRWTEFDTVWEAAIRVCDRYELGKCKRAELAANQPDTNKPAADLPLTAEDYSVVPCASCGDEWLNSDSGSHPASTTQDGTA